MHVTLGNLSLFVSARILAGLGQAARRRIFAAMPFDRALRSPLGDRSSRSPLSDRSSRSPLNRLRDISISLVGQSRRFGTDRAVSLTDTLIGRLSSA
jgi:hypothetical protein